MRFKSATVKSFKRFTDLTVQGIPDTARLIMLAGPNGSGKSSFFDALHAWQRVHAGRGATGEYDYYDKASQEAQSSEYYDRVKVEFHDQSNLDLQQYKKALYVRSAYRNDPDLQDSPFRREGDPLDNVRISRTIDNDAAVNQNYQKLAGQTFDIYDVEPIMSDEFTDSIIGPIRDPITRLFPDLTLNSLANPIVDGTFRFTKGVSEGFHFKNLSGGEKAAFDLILDLVVARRAYDDTIFCIDEPESHMNARVQAELLSVLYDLTPENCQLILATHSIGMMRRARDIDAEKPGSVVFLNFDGHEFDEQVVIEPTVPDRAFWSTTYEIALADLAALVAPERVIICEGEPVKSGLGNGQSFDAKCYDRIFNTEFPETRFISMGSDRQIIGDQRGLAEALRLLIGGLDVARLVDRDNRSDRQIDDLTSEEVRVLRRRNLESYLFDDEVLLKLTAESGGSEAMADRLVEKKQSLKETSPGGRSDDLKPLARDIRVACEQMLGINQGGNDTVSFMIDTLAPLIKPGMAVYDDLKRDIFG